MDDAAIHGIEDTAFDTERALRDRLQRLEHPRERDGRSFDEHLRLAERHAEAAYGLGVEQRKPFWMTAAIGRAQSLLMRQVVRRAKRNHLDRAKLPSERMSP